MGLDVTFHMPPGRFVRVEVDGSTRVFHGDESVVGAKWLDRLVREQADESLYRDLDADELREVADAVAAVEYDPSFAEEYHAVRDREDFEHVVTRFEAYAAAGGTMTASF